MDFSLCKTIVDNISQVIVGKQDAIELMLVGLLGEGHVLIEDVPGVGKTLMAKSLATSIGGQFKRIQFTPDLLPADVTGFNVFHPRTGEFTFKSGPVMTHVLLADEINRTVPRTQSSLLEGMEERQVTIDGVTQKLPRPFFVLATQNPIELEGTFPLPEAQLDRFLLKIRLGYPDAAQEVEILRRFQENSPVNHLKSVADPDRIAELQHMRKRIHVSSAVRQYIADMVGATRNHPVLRFGASPRGSLGLMRAGQALAALRGRDFVLPDDIKALAVTVLAHRLILKPEERLRGATTEIVISEIADTLPVPTHAAT